MTKKHAPRSHKISYKSLKSTEAINNLAAEGSYPDPTPTPLRSPTPTNPDLFNKLFAELNLELDPVDQAISRAKDEALHFFKEILNTAQAIARNQKEFDTLTASHVEQAISKLRPPDKKRTRIFAGIFSICVALFFYALQNESFSSNNWMVLWVIVSALGVGMSFKEVFIDN